jgi:tRNA:m4X modification enzyme
MPKCEYFIPKRQRSCGFEVKQGERFCGNHLHLASPHDASAARVPCPIDGTHDVAASELFGHLKKCPRLRDIRKDRVGARLWSAGPSTQHPAPSRSPARRRRGAGAAEPRPAVIKPCAGKALLLRGRQRRQRR